MSETPRVKQPALSVLRERRITVPGLAVAIKTNDARSQNRLRHILYGYVVPNVDEMYAIGAFLGMKIEDLFTNDTRTAAFSQAVQRTGTGQ